LSNVKKPVQILIAATLVILLVIGVLFTTLREVKTVLASCPTTSDTNLVSIDQSLTHPVLTAAASPAVISVGETLGVTISSHMLTRDQLSTPIGFRILLTSTPSADLAAPVEVYRSEPQVVAVSPGNLEGSANLKWVVPTLPTGTYTVEPITSNVRTNPGGKFTLTPATFEVQSLTPAVVLTMSNSVSPTSAEGSEVNLPVTNLTDQSSDVEVAATLYEGNQVSDGGKVGTYSSTLKDLAAHAAGGLRIKLPAKLQEYYQPVLQVKVSSGSFTQQFVTSLSGGQQAPTLALAKVESSGGLFKKISGTVCLSNIYGASLEGVRAEIAYKSGAKEVAHATVSNFGASDGSLAVQDVVHRLTSTTPQAIEVKLLKGDHLLDTFTNTMQ